MHLCFKLWTDEPLYEYLKLFLEARVLKHHQRHTFFFFFCKTSLTNKEIAKRNRINFTGGMFQSPSSSQLGLHRRSFIMICPVLSGKLSFLETQRSINAQKNTHPEMIYQIIPAWHSVLKQFQGVWADTELLCGVCLCSVLQA